MGEEVKPPVHVKQKTIKKIGGVLAAPFRRRPKARNGGNVTQKGPAVAAALGENPETSMAGPNLTLSPI